MARKKTTDSIATPPALEPESSAAPQRTTNGSRPRGRRKPAAQAEPTPQSTPPPSQAQTAAAPSLPADELQAVTQDLEERKRALESLRRHTHSAAIQLAALRHQAVALSQEMEQTRREMGLEAGRVGELRQETQALQERLQEATGCLEEMNREMGEARGRLVELRREADEASRTAAALRTRSLEAATEVAEASAAVRQTLQQAAEAAVEYASVSARLGAESDRLIEEAAAAVPPPAVHEPMQLGVTVAVNSGEVLEVSPDSPAARAGVTTGDVILSANGEAVRNGSDLRDIVASLAGGQEIVLRIERSGTPEEVRAHLPQTAATSPA